MCTVTGCIPEHPPPPLQDGDTATPRGLDTHSMWVSHFFPALDGEHRLAFMVLAEGPFVPIIFPLLAQSGKESMTGG